MPHNPYQPPGAELADPLPAAGRVPARVSRACILVVAAFALGLVTLVPGIDAPVSGEPPLPFVFTAALVLLFGGVTLWLVAQAHHGRNWARWALLLYLAAGWLLWGSQVTEEFLRSPVVGFINVACIAMEALACRDLFFGDAARWYAAMSKRPAADGA